MMTTLINPSDSIDIAIAQQQLQFETTTINDYPDVRSVVENILTQLGVSELTQKLNSVKVLSYPYQFVIQENGGITMVYSFAVIEGQKGDTLQDKVVLDPKTLAVAAPAFQLPTDAPFIVLGKVNETDQKYLICSIAHEISHILIDDIENNSKLVSQLSAMIPHNIQNIPADETLPIMFEIKVLKELFDGQEIMKYLIDRYIIDYEENAENSENYIKDLRALVAVA